MDKLGKYEIVEKIGVGGFGVVYKGYDPFIKRHVAVKTCSAEDRETRDRFLREAEIAGNLQHRNIVTVFEFGFHGEVPYLVQEFLSGEDLDHKIRRRDAVPIADKVAWLVEIARGLSFAHERGVVHRDIKPANVRILDDNNAKILDFGIAKLAQQQSTLTQVGVTLGTASYLAPEQIRGEAVDTRTDVFSFGVLAYELLTYERPFRAQEISATFYKILNDTPAPIPSKVAGVPQELERVVLRCLEKDPAKRWFPTTELVTALERLDRRSVTYSPALEDGASSERTTAIPREERTRQLPATAPAPTPRAVGLGEVDLAPAAARRSEAPARAAARRPGGGRLFRRLLGAATVLALGGALVLVVSGKSPRELQQLLFAPPATTSNRAATTPAPAAAKKATKSPTVKSSKTSAGAAPAAPASPPDAKPAQAESRGEPAPGPAVPAAAPAAASSPKRGRLVIGPAWDPGMTATIGERRYRLDRQQTIEVPAGLVPVVFAIETPVYAFRTELRLQVAGGATEQVSIPIEKPGRLSVQPHLNSRPGTIRLDGEVAGATPLRGRWLAPGQHFVEVFAAGGDPSMPGFAQSVAVRSDVETIVTFDLDGVLAPTVRERPLSSP